MEAGHTPQGKSLFERHLHEIRRVIAFVSRRHHLSSAEAEDFASEAMLRLLDDDCSVLRRFEGRSSMPTFLTVVINRLFLDYRAKAWGKWRPSAEALRGGEVTILLERLIVRDGHTLEEAAQLMATHHQIELDTRRLDELVARLPRRVTVRFETEDALQNVPSEDVAPDERAGANLQQPLARKINDVLKSLMAKLEPQDRLILAMRFNDGYQVSRIANSLGLDQKGLYRRIPRLLRSLRTSLEAEGYDAKIVGEALVSVGLTGGDWDATGESPDTRPSIGKGAYEWN